MQRSSTTAGIAAAAGALLLTSFAVLAERSDDLLAVSAQGGDGDGATPDAIETHPVEPRDTVGEGIPTASTPGTVLVGGPSALTAGLADHLAACADVTRVSGSDRWATAVAAARDLDAVRGDEATTVLLASGRSFPDALAAAPVVIAEDAVLLLTDGATLPEPTRAELERRRPDRVVVLGGTAAISEQVESQVARWAALVERLSGPDRYATAAALATRLPDAPDEVVLAAGTSFADALSIGPHAARTASPVLLTRADRLPDSTATALQDADPALVTVVGGTGVVGEDVLAEVRRLLPDATVRRVSGPDRHATSAQVAATTTGPLDGGAAVLVTGSGFADALAAAPLAAVRGAPLLLSPGGALPPPVATAWLAATDSTCTVTTLRVDPTEALTLGPSTIGGTTLAWAAAGATGGFRRADDTGALVLPPGATTTVAFTYPTPAGGVPPVAWTQQVPADVDEVVARQEWRGRPAPVADTSKDLVVAWQYTGDSARYRREVDAAPGLTVTAPFRYFLGASGNLSGSGADGAFIADMHARGVEVWPTIHTGGAAAIRAALADPARRAQHARAIVADATAKGADGVNIDIEGYELSEAEAVTDFVEQFAVLAREAGLVTSFDFTTMTDTWITPPPGYEFWSTAPDRRRISEAVDYAILMAYDEFNRFRPRGPVASEKWVEEGLRYQLRYSDPARTLLGVPLYGRTWAGNTPAAVGIGRIEEYVRDGVREFDPRFGIDRVTLGGRVTWAETVAGLQHRVDLVDEYGLGGTASWRLGFDVPAVWDVLGAR